MQTSSVFGVRLKRMKRENYLKTKKKIHKQLKRQGHTVSKLIYFGNSRQVAELTDGSGIFPSLLL